jgi:hypothetical protein
MNKRQRGTSSQKGKPLLIRARCKAGEPARRSSFAQLRRMHTLLEREQDFVTRIDIVLEDDVVESAAGYPGASGYL